MYKLSDRLDLIDKGFEIYNYAIEKEEHNLASEITWLDENMGNTELLRAYLLQFLTEEWVKSYKNEDVRKLVQIRKNTLVNRIFRLKGCKVNTDPLKVIEWELKYLGR